MFQLHQRSCWHLFFKSTTVHCEIKRGMWIYVSTGLTFFTSSSFASWQSHIGEDIYAKWSRTNIFFITILTSCFTRVGRSHVFPVSWPFIVIFVFIVLWMFKLSRTTNSSVFPLIDIFFFIVPIFVFLFSLNFNNFCCKIVKHMCIKYEKACRTKFKKVLGYWISVRDHLFNSRPSELENFIDYKCLQYENFNLVYLCF